MHLKRRPFGRPIEVVFSMAFATTGPLRASLDQCPSATTMHPPWAGGASRGALAVELLRPLLPIGGQRMRSTRPVAPGFEHPGLAAQARLQQIFDKADAIVLEHHAIAFLGCVKIDIGANGEIMVAIGITKGLLHMPHVLRFLIGFIDSQKRH